MRRYWFGLLLAAALVSVGCGMEKGSIVAPSAVESQNISGGGGSIRPLSLVTGTWTGTETASVGESGAISVTFTQTPTADTAVSASIGGLGYSGTLTGTLDHMVITVTDYRCGYVAVGNLNAAGTQITGTYTGTGPGVCSTKAGTFILSGQSYVPPVDTCIQPTGNSGGNSGGNGGGNSNGGNNSGGNGTGNGTGNDHDPQPCHGNDPGQGNNAHG